jgi:hypothetical protein
VLLLIKSGDFQGNMLLDKNKRSLEGVPDYNAIVRLEQQI